MKIVKQKIAGFYLKPFVRVLFCGLVLASPLTFAQKANFRKPQADTFLGQISGQVFTEGKSETIPFATVTLFKVSAPDKPFLGAIADENGGFKIEKVPVGNYILTIDAIGYGQKKIENITTSLKKPDAKLGDVEVGSDAQKLKEVVVQAQANTVENRIDKIVFNVDKDASLIGSTADDALRKAPYVSMDADGNPSIRGNSNIKILVDGKPSVLLSSDPAEALKSFPADQIKQVEVITNPSAKYEAEGSAGIINIVTKKNKLEGFLTNVAASIGDAWNNGNVSVSTKKNRLEVNASANVRYNWPLQANSYFRQDWNNSDFILREGDVKTQRIAGGGSFGLNYDFNKFNTIGASVNYRRVSYTKDGSVALSYSDVSQNTSLAQNSERFRDNLDANLNFAHFFSANQDKPHKIEFLLQLNNGDNNTHFDNSYASNLTSNKGKNLGLNKEFSGQIDYTLPLGKATTFETGVRFQYRNVLSNYDASVFSTTTENILNEYDYKQEVSAAYVNWVLPLSKRFSLLAGVRYEGTKISGVSKEFDERAPKVDRNYDNLFPSVTLNYKVGVHTLKASYNQRISRPRIGNINPYGNAFDPQNITYGNPNILPEIINNYEIGYSGFLKFLLLNVTLFYEDEKDEIDRYTFSRQSEGSVTSYYNIGRSTNIGLNTFLQITIRNKLSLRGNFNLFKWDSSPYEGFEVNTDSRAWVYRSFLSASYTQKSYVFEVFGLFNSPRRSVQGTKPTFTLFVVSLKKQIFKKNGSLGLSIIDPFTAAKDFTSEIASSDFRQTSTTSIRFRSITLNFSYKIGQLKVKQKGQGGGDMGGGDDSNY